MTADKNKSLVVTLYLHESTLAAWLRRLSKPCYLFYACEPGSAINCKALQKDGKCLVYNISNFIK